MDSVLAQTFADFELLVIDDGSRDHTGEVVSERNDPRVNLVGTENGGVAAARNRGLELASGSYVAFLDADDGWEPTKLELQHRAMTETPAAGLSFASARIVDDDLRPTGIDAAVHRTDYTEALLLEGNIVAGSASSVMARSAAIDLVGGFDPGLSQCADWDMWLRMSAVTDFLALDEALAHYRSVPGTMSSDPRLLERDTFAMLDKFYTGPQAAAYARVRNRAYANQWMVCAGTYLHARRLRDSLRCVASGLRSDPRTARRLVSLPVRWAGRAGPRTKAYVRGRRRALSGRP